MPNIGALLKNEISRLSRREIRKATTSLKNASASYRREIAALKRQVAALQKKSTSLEKRTSVAASHKSTELPDRPVRFVAKGLRSLRLRLGLSAPQLALLLGVSEQSIYNWETKKATPRKEQFAAIIAMRGIGKREAQERLAVVKSAQPVRAKKGRVAQ
ncbi:helix-turn-helix domain-containing protein [Rudaea sp.]|uniref:helix-turn-helix domain-containing protein n=1 Tax=Rudaea sp. TaxID=2136325 RepID=UPI003783E857